MPRTTRPLAAVTPSDVAVTSSVKTVQSRLGSRAASARPERCFVIRVAAWDASCPQHIPVRLDAPDVAAALEVRDRRIAAPEAEVQRLRDGALDRVR